MARPAPPPPRVGRHAGGGGAGRALAVGRHLADLAALDAGPGPLHSVCVAFGLERWIYSFMAQHGIDPGVWPRDVMKGLDLVRSERSRL